MSSRLAAVLLSRNCAEFRTCGMSGAVRRTFPREKSSSPSRRLLSKPKPDMDWIGSKGVGPHCSFPCFEYRLSTALVDREPRFEIARRGDPARAHPSIDLGQFAL